MKKFFTLMLLAMCCNLSLQAQGYNLFDAEDVDENGWLWLDTRAKINKYVGDAYNYAYVVDTNGKLIQMVNADIDPDYPACYASPYIIGAGTDGTLEGEGALTGGIQIPASTGMLQTNGGGIVICMPSCHSLSICMSNDAQVRVRMMGTKDVKTKFSQYDVISAKYAGFSSLFKSGIYVWEGIEKLTNGYDDGYALEGNEPVYAYLQNCYNEFFVHGLKVMTNTDPAGVDDAEIIKNKIFFINNVISIAEESQIDVFNLSGVLVKSAYASKLSLEDMSKGIYIVKVGKNTSKVSVE